MVGIGLLFSAASNCKKAVDKYSQLKKVPEQAYNLWLQADTLQQPLQLALRLASREETAAIVLPAVRLTIEVLQRCDDLATRAEDEEVSDVGGWESWWNEVPTRARARLQRCELIPKLSQQLAQCSAALQLAFTTVQLECGPEAARATPKLEITTSLVFERCRFLSHELEMARVTSIQLGGARLWSRKSAKSGEWSLVHPHVGMLLKKSAAAGANFEVCIVAPTAQQREAVKEKAILEFPLVAKTTVELQPTGNDRTKIFSIILNGTTRLDYTPAILPRQFTAVTKASKASAKEAKKAADSDEDEEDWCEDFEEESHFVTIEALLGILGTGMELARLRKSGFDEAFVDKSAWSSAVQSSVSI